MKSIEAVVYAVGKHYQILVPTDEENVMWIEIETENDELLCYYDNSNGILRSKVLVHRAEVPMSVLDAAKSYTVCIRPMLERRAYFSQTGEVIRKTFSFRPVCSLPIRLYHIADTHSLTEEPVTAAGSYTPIDLLVLNGDIPEDSSSADHLVTIHQIAWKITRGEVPTVFARGNHDLRGVFADRLTDYIPTENGKTYYTFHLGPVWGLVLDCGEDKNDTHPEYGHTICCHPFRLQETAFLHQLVQNAEEEYRADDIKIRLVIVHHPFTEPSEEPFDIEKEIFSEWLRILNEVIHPNLMICGHLHEAYIVRPEKTDTGVMFPVVVGSIRKSNPVYFAGAGIEIHSDHALISVTDQTKACLWEDSVDFY